MQDCQSRASDRTRGLYRQSIVVRHIGLDDVDVLALELGFDLLVCRGLISDEPEDGILWIFRELLQEFELCDVFSLMMHLDNMWDLRQRPSTRL